MAPQVATRRASLPSHFRAGRRVLVVEEEKQDREYYCTVLREHGFEVSACESVAEGARRLENGQYDFVMVEQGGHAFEGRLVLERVLAIDRRLPTVVLTRCADMHCYLEAMQLGAVDYLEKPLSDSDLIRVVETHLRPQSTAA